MCNLIISIASQTHQTTILEILIETQNWLRSKGINQWTLPFTSEWISESIEQGEFFIVCIEDQLVAVFRLTITDPSVWGEDANNALYIHSLAVRLDWRGRQLGSHILNWIEQYAVQNQQSYLRLDCMAGNHVLCQYYEQAGFVAHQIKEFWGGESTYKAQLFEKKVA